MKKATIILVFITISLNLFAFRVRKPDLQELIDSSEYVVYGTVIYSSAIDTIKEKELKQKYDYWIYCDNLEYIAKLKVLTQFKGKEKLDTISILFGCGYNGYCQQFIKNDTLVTFLMKNADDTFKRRSCYYGIKSKGPEEFSQRIKEYLSIKEINDSIRLNNELTEWTIKCAEGHYTSWDGMFQIQSQWIKIGQKKYPLNLSTEQKERLYKALLSYMPYEYEHEDLLDFICTFNKSNELKEYILLNLKKLESSEAYLTAYDLMSAYAKIDENKKLEGIYKQYLSSYNEDDENRFKLIQKFIYEIEKK